MMRKAKLRRRHEFDDVVFDVARRLAERQSQTVGNAKDVRVDGKGCFLEGDRHDDARSLAAHARQRFEFLAR